MATQPAPALSVVPTAETQREIENTLDAPRKLLDAIEDWKKKRAGAIAQQRPSRRAAERGESNRQLQSIKSEEEARAAKIETAEKRQEIIEERTKELRGHRARLSTETVPG